MSDPKKKKQTDSTTDFFLQFMKEEKSDKEKTEAKKEEREQTYTKTVEKFSSGYNYFNKLLDKLLANKHSVRILSFVLAIFLFVSFSLVATSVLIEKTLKASETDNVPSAESFLPVKGKLSGPLWHCEFILTLLT